MLQIVVTGQVSMSLADKGGLYLHKNQSKYRGNPETPTFTGPHAKH